MADSRSNPDQLQSSVDLLLEKLAYSPDLMPFRKLIEPLVVHDQERRSDLVRTLRVYFASGANASEAAGRLYLHRNSMLYRLARIQRLTGLDLKDPRARLVLQLGLLTINKPERSANDAIQYP
jgi:DNA-binding PucR family transcriptional regulator